MRKWGVLLAAALVVFGCGRKRHNWPEGMLIPMEPKQVDHRGKPKMWMVKDFRLESLATFDVYGRVLLTENFSSGMEAKLSPKDLTLGWGPMSSDILLKQIELSHSGRFYYYRYQSETNLSEQVGPNSANMHIIPANDSVATTLKAAGIDDLVRIQGHLVAIEGPDGWSWRSSVTRTDSGAGACEIIYADKMEILLAPPPKPL